MRLPRRQRRYIAEGLRRLRMASLPEYHASEVFHNLREGYWSRHNGEKYKCAGCGKRDHLQLHEKSYKNMGFQPDSDLCWYCDACHEAEHRRIEQWITAGWLWKLLFG